MSAQTALLTDADRQALINEGIKPVTARRPWAETPLGRYQAEERARRDAFNALVDASKPSAAEQAESAARWRDSIKERTAANVRHHAAKRRSLKLQRTPAWADTQAIEAVYQEARRLSTATGIPHHVDHEIPLQGRLVSGLHVHQNLQVLTGPENSRKSNHFEVSP